jgi:tripartite-type tricarboxylate transporter receptor subunit TctC
MKHRVGGICAAALLAAAMGAAQAQSYPSKTIRMICPFSPGGNVDITSRTVAPPLGTKLGQQVIVENRPGATGQIAAKLVMEAPADGYTIMMVSSSVMTNAPAVYPNLAYDILKDFVPIGRVTEVPLVFVVNPSLPATTTKELIALGKTRPNELLIASGGRGSTSHLITELFAIEAGIKLTVVPYKGSGPAVRDLLGGHVMGRIDQVSSSLGHIREGRLRAIAVTTAQRAAALPDVPTLAESGLPGFNASTVTGLLAAAGTPDDIVGVLEKALMSVLKESEVVQRFTSLGADAQPSTSAEFAKFIREDLAKWKRVVKEAGIKPN